MNKSLIVSALECGMTTPGTPSVWFRERGAVYEDEVGWFLKARDSLALITAINPQLPFLATASTQPLLSLSHGCNIIAHFLSS